MTTIHVNDRAVEAEPGELLLHAIRRAGVSVPTLCYMEDRPPTGACRMCVVEIEGRPGLVPSCSCPVSEGMRVQTHSSRAQRARKTIVELLLADHPDDCLYCVRNGSCQLQELAEQYGVRQRRYTGETSSHRPDLSSPSIVRDQDKCILCGKCVRVCEEVMGVSAIDFVGRGCQATVGTAFESGLNTSTCVACGQCILACPTGALREQSYAKQVTDALLDPARTVVVQHAPAISVSIGEELGLKPGQDAIGVLNAALRRLGAARVFDTSFSADLTIMEEASELARRIQEGGVLPMFTSCCPAWIKFVEQEAPDLIDNLSTCKSPQQMLGALIKGIWAEREELDPASVYSVSVMPCTAKKFESQRPEMGRDGQPDVDAVLSTRELARLIRARGIDPTVLEPEEADLPFGERSTAGKIFGATGGVMEAALRTAYWKLTGRNLGELKVKAVRGQRQRKEAHVDIDGLTVGVAVVHGLGGMRALLEEIRAGRDDLHFIEVMSCPGGCVGGGGQPYATDLAHAGERAEVLYRLDRDARLRLSHENRSLAQLYEKHLGEPLGARSHELLHTHYHSRNE